MLVCHRLRCKALVNSSYSTEQEVKNLDKKQNQTRTKELKALIKEADAAIKKSEADLKVAKKVKADLEKEFRRLEKSIKEGG